MTIFNNNNNIFNWCFANWCFAEYTFMTKCNPVKRKQKSYCQTAPFRILQVKTNDSASRLQNSSNPLRMRKKLIVHLKVGIIRNTIGVLVQKRAVWLPTINGPILILYSTFIRRVFRHVYILHWNVCYLISMYIDAPMEHQCKSIKN